MSWGTFCNDYSKAICIMEEIGLKQAVKLSVKENLICYDWDLNNVPPIAQRLIIDHHDNTADMLEMFLMSRVFSEGPKVFDVGQIDFEMLIQMDVNVPMSEYNQPFPTYIIQLPEQFCKNRVVECLQAGQTYCGVTASAEHEPDFIVLHHDKSLGAVVFGLFFKGTGQSIKTGFGATDETLIETMLGQSHKPFRGSLEVSQSEWQLTADLVRAALNYSLLIDEVGSRRLPSAHEDRLKRHLEKAKKSLNRDRILRAETELRRNPIKYELNQEVQLFKDVDKLPTEGEHSGRIMSPHHRRGHYRMQRVGVGRTERRRVRIPPVFVNAHRFLGDIHKTKVKYK